MQVKSRFREPIETGEVTLIFRRWVNRQVGTGKVYRTSAGRLQVIAIDEVDPEAITDDDARRAGAADADAVRAELHDGPGRTTYRIEVRPVFGPDPRDRLAATDALDDDDVAEIDERLDALDAASTHGPWTMATLHLISARPNTLSTDLAVVLRRERDPFKRDVRKLKGLGLTESLTRGYRISARGQAYLARTTRAARAARTDRRTPVTPTATD